MRADAERAAPRRPWTKPCTAGDVLVRESDKVTQMGNSVALASNHHPPNNPRPLAKMPHSFGRKRSTRYAVSP